MKLLIRIFLVTLLFSLASCSSDSSTTTDGEAQDNTIAAKPMKVRIDSQPYLELRNTDGTTNSILSGTAGNYTHVLYGYNEVTNALNRIPITPKEIKISLFVPESSITVGEHLFSSTQQPSDFYGNVGLYKVNGVEETVNTTNGKIVIESYDSSSRLLKGTFLINTNDGTNPNHTFSGTFEYVLSE